MTPTCNSWLKRSRKSKRRRNEMEKWLQFQDVMPERNKTNLISARNIGQGERGYPDLRLFYFFSWWDTTFVHQKRAKVEGINFGWRPKKEGKKGLCSADLSNLSAPFLTPCPCRDCSQILELSDLLMKSFKKKRGGVAGSDRPNLTVGNVHWCCWSLFWDTRSDRSKILFIDRLTFSEHGANFVLRSF